MRGSRVVGTVALCLGIAFSCVAGAAAQGGPEWQPGGRGRAYARALLGPGAILSIGVGTAIDQSRNDPAEWGDDLPGFWKRLGSNAAENTVDATIHHGLAAVMDRSVVYQKCSCTGFGPRLGHAFLETLTSRDKNGHRMIDLPRFAGAYGGVLIESTWRPNRQTTDILTLGTGAIVFGGLSNAWREFVGWP